MFEWLDFLDYCVKVNTFVMVKIEKCDEGAKNNIFDADFCCSKICSRS